MLGLAGLGIAGIFGTLGTGTDAGDSPVIAGNQLLDAILFLLNHAVTNPDIGAGNLAHGLTALAAILGLGSGLLRGFETQRRTEVGQSGKPLAAHVGRDNTLVLQLFVFGHRKFPFHSRKNGHLYIQL